MPTPGFVSNLAHTVIKEQEDELTSIHSAGSIDSDDELTDDQLALMGAPWAKEGNLVRKLYWEAPGKRNKDKAWKETFAVLQKGEMQMFAFGEGSAPDPGSVVGGGNWLVSEATSGLSRYVIHALISHLAVDKCPSDWRLELVPCTSVCPTTAGVQFVTAALFQLDTSHGRDGFFPSRYRGISARVGVNVQLLGRPA